MIQLTDRTALVTRDEWGARAPKSKAGFDPDLSTAHWEGPGMGSFDHGACFSYVRGIQAFHMDTRGWADIAYNGVVCPHGYVFQGRWLDVRSGANGTNPGNAKAYAWCYLGGVGDPFTAEGRVAMRDVIEYAKAHGGAPDAPNGHRDWKPTQCLPLDITQVLTPQGWKLLADVTPDDEVASYAVDGGQISFDRPLGFAEPREAATVTIRGVEMTADHRLYARTSHRKPIKQVTAADLMTGTTQWVVPASGQWWDAEGLPVDLDLIRLLVWVQADGHYATKQGRLDHLGFHFSKDRKIERVVAILDALEKPYRLALRADNTTTIKVYGVEWLRHNVLQWLPEKAYTWTWLTLTPDQFDALDGELLLADGCTANGRYSSAVEQNLEVLLALYHLNGRRAERSADPKFLNLGLARARNDYLTVDPRSQAGAGRDSTTVGCITTVNDTILVRQGGRVMVVGNCPGDEIYGWLAAGMPVDGGSSPPLPVPTDPGQPTIRYGSRGPAVEVWQDYVRQVVDATIRVDGVFGARTVEATKAFQRRVGLVADGIVGPRTWQAAIENPPGDGPAPTRPTIRLGDRGDDVRYAQQRLNFHGARLGVDGVFGSKTHSAVRSFQSRNGLGVDGVVGPATWAALG